MKGHDRLKTLEQKYEERKNVIRKRYRFHIITLMFGLILLLPAGLIFDKVFSQNLVFPLIILYLSMFFIPWIFFVASSCPKCQKTLLSLSGNNFKKFLDYPHRCMHCGFSVLGEK